MNKNNRTQWREWESHEAHQYVCNDVDPSSDAFVSELCITSPGKDILPDLVASTAYASVGRTAIQPLIDRGTGKSSTKGS